MAVLWVPLVLVLLAALVGRLLPRAWGERLAPLMQGPWVPVALGVVSALLVRWEWGSFDPVPWIHDEYAYRLQAEIFARLHWTMPGRPLPEFFEQFHVFVTPRLAPKYPPGHAILMVPGIWLGLPALGPIALAGIAAALLFVVVRRVNGNAWLALLTWIFWVTTRAGLDYRPTYLSESTSTVLWLLGWWALLRWRDEGGTRRGRWWLALVALCVGWGALTRPLTEIAWCIPAGAAILWLLVRRGWWRDLAPALVVGVGCLAIIPIWSHATTGSWTVTPYSLYSKVYFPFDKAGFGVDMSPAQRPLPPDMEEFTRYFRPNHYDYTVRILPRVLAERLPYVQRDMWAGWRAPYVWVAALGLAAITVESAVALATAACLMLLYLTFAIGAGWTVYYVELQTVLAYFSATGTWLVLTLLTDAAARRRPAAMLATAPRAALGTVAFAVLVLPLCAIEAPHGRQRTIDASSYQRTFFETVGRLPGGKRIVFVHYAPDHNIHTSLIANVPDLASAPTWFAYDRGPDDMRLMALAPGRRAWLFDEARHTFRPIDPGAPPAR